MALFEVSVYQSMSSLDLVCVSLAHAAALLENIPVHTLTHLADCVFRAPARLASLVNSSAGASGCRGSFNAAANG